MSLDAILRAVRLGSVVALLLACSACSASGLEHRSRSGVTVVEKPAAILVRTAPPSAPADPATLTDAQLAERAHDDLASLGTLSVGSPNRGALVNAVQMPEDPRWHVVDPAHAFGTPDAVASIADAVDKVNVAYPDSEPLYIGHLSAPEGGRLHPHKSHQSGRDVDLGYYYRNGAKWYARANAKNLDLARTWELVKAFGNDPNVEAIFMDRSVQFLLKRHALEAKQDPKFVDSLFAKNRRDWTRLIHHEWGHLTHLHVRFKSSAPSQLGYRAHTELLALGVIPPKHYY